MTRQVRNAQPRSGLADAVGCLLSELAARSISDDDVDQLIKLGFSERDIADMVGIVALNVLTGAFNLATGVGVARRRS